jgi:hypothetical protein
MTLPQMSAALLNSGLELAGIGIAFVERRPTSNRSGSAQAPQIVRTVRKRAAADMRVRKLPDTVEKRPMIAYRFMMGL